jgi:signal transduction histidine kinase
MPTRPKPFLVYLLFCLAPLLLLSGLNYWNATRAVDSTVSAIVQDDLNSFTAGVDDILHDQESSILRLAMTRDLQRVLEIRTGVDSNSTRSQATTLAVTENDEVLQRNAVSSLKSILDRRGYFQSVALFDRNRQPLWFGKNSTRWEEWGWGSNTTFPSNLPQPDDRVWGLQGSVLLDKPGSSTSSNASLEYTVPIHDESGIVNQGALVGVLDLEPVFSSTVRGLEARSSRGTTQSSMVIILDHAEQIVYHSDRWLKLRSASSALPGFGSIAKAMISNQSGLAEFRSGSGPYYLAAFSPIPRLNLSVAVARDLSEFRSSARRWGIAGFAVALLIALAGARLIEQHVQRKSRGMERVTEDLSAIAKGELDRRIELKSSDDARVIADNINVVTERLRAQLAREAESRQFESFLRLSAMLTHDLKNSIEALSLTVGNMERHFDNEQFRVDALKSLTSATEKLKAIVARLTRPLTSLSGEHKRPLDVDLVPVLRRVVAMTAEPLREKHKIELKLPRTLFALVDPSRIEEVVENLVLNALEAMANKGGTLTIEAGHTESGAPMFSVSDTGPGMSPSFIETRLFRPFSTTKKTGIGLGLYTCREVVQAGAGSIEVESVEGAGTTFRVVLPSPSNDRRD